MAGFDLEAAMVGMRDLMLTIPELDSVGIGAPEAQASWSFGWVTLGDPEDIGRVAAGGPYDLPINLICWFGYNVEGQEEAAERQLARWIADFTRAVIQNRAGAVGAVDVRLNGTVERMGLPHAAAGAPEYARFAGAETRIFPLGVLVTLRELV